MQAARIAAAKGVLGFAQSEPITADTIKARHRQLVKRHHPDKPGGSALKTSAINNARDILLESLEAT